MEKTEATAAARITPSDVPLRLESRLTRLGAHGPTHVVMGLNGRTVASMRLEKNRQRAVLQSLKMNDDWETPVDVVRVFDLVLAWARAGGAAELEYRGCDCLWVYTLLEGQFGPGLLCVWSLKEKKWKMALEPDMAMEVRSLPPTASPTRSVSGLTLLAPTAGVLYRGTTVSDLRKNRIEESGGNVRWVGGRAGFLDAPLFTFKWSEAQEYAETRQTAQDPAVVIEVSHDALAAAGRRLPLFERRPPATRAVGGRRAAFHRPCDIRFGPGDSPLDPAGGSRKHPIVRFRQSHDVAGLFPPPGLWPIRWKSIPRMNRMGLSTGWVCVWRGTN